MKIRKANKKDLKVLSKIYMSEYSKKPYNESWSSKNSLNRIRSLIKNTTLFVAEIKGIVVGFISSYFFQWDKEIKGYVEEFLVSEEYQNRGIGDLLLKKTEGELKKRNAKEIWLNANKKSKVIKFYKKRGYQIGDFIELQKRLK